MSKISPWILPSHSINNPKNNKINELLQRSLTGETDCPKDSNIDSPHNCYEVSNLPKIYHESDPNDNLQNHLPNILVPDLIPSNANPWDHFPVIGQVQIEGQDPPIKVITLNCGLGGDNDSPLEFWNNELLKNEVFKAWSDSIKTNI